MDPHNHDAIEQRATTKRPWQYSLFGLLVVTTIISVCLAVGVNYPRTVLTILTVGLVQVVALYSIEWLMHRRGGRTMRRVTVSLWTVVIVAAFVMVVGLASVGALHWIKMKS